MKTFRIDNFIGERAKVKPITNSEWDSAKKELEKIKANPFGLIENDLVGQLKGFPMGVVVRMLEEQKKQNKNNKNYRVDITPFQQRKDASYSEGGFDWDTAEFDETKYPKGVWRFWSNVINNEDFYLFYEVFPEYRKYNN